uniref:mRNA export factor GLE1 n=1 Tax=Saccoglossus kowalevskii TaxID=10224 RepID=A0ABM0MWF0_SACKO|nr:PREDICTED: nucleoporin GLE1-like [Saccoglossus kowalevskii]
MSSTIDALRSSSKGKLKYDPHWHEQGRAKQVLDECASPPTLSLRSRRDVLDCSDDSMSEAASVISQQSSDVSGPHVKVTSIEPVIDSSDSMSCSSIEDSLVHSPTILNGCIEVSIMQCEKYWEKKAEFAAKLVREKQELYWKTLKVQAEQQLAALERKAELDERKAAERLQMLEMRTREESRKRQLKRKEDVKHHAVMVETKMKAVEAKRGQELEEEKKKTEEAKKILSHVSNLHHLVNLYTDRATQLLANCKHKEFITENVKNLTDHIRVLKEVSDHVLSDAQSKEMAIAELETMGKVYTKAKQVVEQTNKIVGDAEKRGNEEMERKKAAEEAEKLAQSTPAPPPPPPPPPLPPPTTTSVPPTSKTDSTTAATAVSTPGELESNITAEAFREYKALQEKRQAILESIKDLTETKDSQLKKYRMDLQKAVNVTINTIANQSGSHLIEKVQRLHSLLSGRSVPVQATGRQRQGGEQVSSSHDSAFPIAAVAVGVWAEFPDFGDLLLAHFHLACPYLVPYYIPKKDGQSEEDYYKYVRYSFCSSIL